MLLCLCHWVFPPLHKFIPGPEKPISSQLTSPSTTYPLMTLEREAGDLAPTLLIEAWVLFLSPYQTPGTCWTSWSHGLLVCIRRRVSLGDLTQFNTQHLFPSELDGKVTATLCDREPIRAFHGPKTGPSRNTEKVLQNIVSRCQTTMTLLWHWYHCSKTSDDERIVRTDETMPRLWEVSQEDRHCSAPS